MECLGPQCAAMLLDWLKKQGAELGSSPATPPETNSPATRQNLLWNASPYQEDAPSLRTPSEWAGAAEHLEYAIFRRYQNQLTRAERSRLDNTIENVLFKMDRYLARLNGPEREGLEREVKSSRDTVREGKERVERLRNQARRAEAKLSQLSTLTPEGFEEFVGEIFEALGYEVEHSGGTGDQGVDLRVRKKGLLGIVQCKYFKGGVVGSPELQKFLGTIHHTRSHKGFFVTTATFSLAAERFVAENPIELIDGSRLVELLHEALGPGANRDAEPTWF